MINVNNVQIKLLCKALNLESPALKKDKIKEHLSHIDNSHLQ